MSGDVATQCFALTLQKLDLVPLVRGGRIVVQGCCWLVPVAVAARGSLLEHPEHGRLAALTIAARAARTLERTVDGSVGPRAGNPHRLERRVESAALHERLEHALVEPLCVQARGKVEQIPKTPGIFAPGETCPERGLAHGGDGPQGEGDLWAEAIA